MSSIVHAMAIAHVLRDNGHEGPNGAQPDTYSISVGKDEAEDQSTNQQEKQLTRNEQSTQDNSHAA